MREKKGKRGESRKRSGNDKLCRQTIMSRYPLKGWGEWIIIIIALLLFLAIGFYFIYD